MKNRANTLAAILGNVEDLEGAYKDALDAEGSAWKENERYMDSIQGRIDLFNNSIQTLWMNLIDSEFAKDIINLGTSFIKFADDVGVLNIALTALAMRMSAKYFKVDFAQWFNIANLKQPIKAIKDWFGAITGGTTTALANLDRLKMAYADAKNAYRINPSQDNLNAFNAARANLEVYQREASDAIQASSNLQKAQEHLTHAQNRLNNYVGNSPKELYKLQDVVRRAESGVADATKAMERFQTSGEKSFVAVGKKIEGFVGQVRSVVASMLVMYAITKLIDFISDAFDKSNESAEEAKKSFNDLMSELDNTKSKLKDLESELSSIEDQIEELNKNTPLSFADQEDLERLQAESAELKRQIEYQKLLQKQQQLGVNQGAINAVEKYEQTDTKTGKTASENIGDKTKSGVLLGAGVGTVAVGSAAAGIGSAVLGAKAGTAIGTAIAPVIGTLIGAAIGALAFGLLGAVAGAIESIEAETIGETMDNMSANYNRLQSEVQSAREKYMKSGNAKDQKKYEEALRAFNNYQSEMATYMMEMDSMYSQIDWETATEEERQAMREFYNQRDKWAILSGGENAKVNALDRLFGEDADDVVKYYAELAKTAVDAGEAFDFTEADAEAIGLSDDLEELGITTQDVANYFTQMGETGAEAIQKIDVSSLVSELSKIEGAFKSVQSAMEEFLSNGIVSASTLEGMQEEFGGLGDAWENYVNTMMSGAASVSEVKKAIEELAMAYLDQNANKIDNKTKLTYIAQLEKFGVANAAELVNSYLSNSFWDSDAFDDFKGDWEDLIELAKEYGITLDENQAKELANAKSKATGAQNTYDQAYKDWIAANKKNADIEKQKEADVKKAETALNELLAADPYNYYTTYYHGLRDALTRSGEYANYSDEDLQAVIDDFKTQLQYGLTNLGLDYTVEDLFPLLMKDYTLEVVPNLTVPQSEVNKTKKELQEICDKLGISVPIDINFNDNNALEETADVEDAFAALKNAYDEFEENNIVSAKTLVGLQETFKNVDGFEKFTNILGDSASTIEEVTAAIQGLANGFLNDFDYSKLFDANGNLIESEARRVASQLENIGVENANELVRQKAWAYNQAKTIYGIDLTNYESAEEAKNGYLVNSVITQIENTGKGLIDGLAEQYQKDLDNYGTTWEEKVKCAKESAQKILEANKQTELSALDAEFEERSGSTQGGVEAQMLEQWYLRQKAMIEQKYAEAKASVEQIDIPNIDTSGIFKYYEPTTIDPEKLGGNDNKGNADSNSEVDWLDHYFTQIDNKIKEKEAELENTLSTDINGLKDKNTIIDEIISLYGSKLAPLETALTTYQQRANDLFNGFSADIQNKIANGSLDIKEYSGEDAEAIQDYFDYIAKASDIKIEIGGLNTKVSDLSKQKFDNIATDFDNQLSIFDSKIAQLEAQNELLETDDGFASENIYKAIKIENEAKKKLLEAQRDALQKELDDGKIEKYSEDWYDAVNAVADVTTEITKLEAEIENLDDEINALHWDKLDLLVKQLDAVYDEAQNLLDILGNMDSVDEFGNWTDEGITSLGLLAQQMEQAEISAEQYAQEIEDLEKNWESLGYTEEEYVEKLAELKSGQYDAIKAYNDAKDAIVDLNKARVDAIKDGIQEEIDAYEELIKKKKEALDSEKDLHDFEKSVQEKQKNISAIERELAALAGNNSMSARAKRAQLEADLAEAKAELEETYYDRSIENQKDALDSELENFKASKDEEIEGWEKYLENTEVVVADSLDVVKKNTESVYTTLKELGEQYSLSITESLTKPWESGETAIQDYGFRLTMTLAELAGLFDLTVDGFAEKLGLTTETLVGNLDITVSQMAENLGLTNEQLAQKLGMDVTELSGMMDLTIQKLATNMGLTLPTLAEKLGTTTSGLAGSLDITVAQFASKMGLTVEQLAGKFGLTTQTLASKLGTTYQDLMNPFGSSMSATVEALTAFVKKYEELLKEIQNESTKTVQKVNDEMDKYKKTQEGPEKEPTGPDGNEKTEQDYYGVALAIWNGNYGWGTGKTRINNLTQKGFDANKVQQIVNQIGKEGYVHSAEWIRKYYGIDDLSKYHFNKYAKGSSGVNKSQLAIIDELGEELQLVPGQNGRLEYLKKGTGIVPADMTQRLMNLAMNPQEMINNNRPAITAPYVTNTESNITMDIGEVVHIDHVDHDTLPDLTKVVQKAMDAYLTKVNSAIRSKVR